MTADGVAAPSALRIGWGGWLGVGVVGAFAVLALAAPSLARFRVTELAGAPLAAPGSRHWLGTNAVGQDVASQVLAGTRTSLAVAVGAGLATLLMATVAGSVAGWMGGLADAVIMRVADVVLVLPTIPLLIVVGAYTDPSLATVSLMIALTSWPAYARVVRSQVRSLRQRDHVRAAVAFGARTTHVLRRHIVPGIGLILGAGLVAAAERAIAFEAGLAFLGLGTSAHGSWGSIMSDALRFRGLFFTRAWTWWLLPPIAAVSMLLMAMAMLGTAFDQRLHPRLARHVPGRATVRA